jgi:hypothetical protein
MAVLRIVRLTPSIYGARYYAMHVAAVLMCLHDHLLLETSPRKLLPATWPAWSLAEYRGTASRGAFARMRNSIGNWGSQYVIAEVLNTDQGLQRAP